MQAAGTDTHARVLDGQYERQWVSLKSARHSVLLSGHAAAWPFLPPIHLPLFHSSWLYSRSWKWSDNVGERTQKWESWSWGRRRVWEADFRLKDNILEIPFCWEHPPPPPPHSPAAALSSASWKGNGLSCPRGPPDLLGWTSKPAWHAASGPVPPPPTPGARTAGECTTMAVHACERGGVWFVLCASSVREHLLFAWVKVHGRQMLLWECLWMYASYLEHAFDVEEGHVNSIKTYYWRFSSYQWLESSFPSSLRSGAHGSI